MVSDDALNGSLFERINESNSTVEVLAGARKFIEGWNSWRVSNMGLLNIGRSEGSQIIQLFGRGVRLRGLNMNVETIFRSEQPAASRTYQITGNAKYFRSTCKLHGPVSGLPGE